MAADIDMVVDQYRARLRVYQGFATRLDSLVLDLCAAERVKVHFVESRAKTPESFRDKLQRPGKAYSDPLVEVPDLVGVRVVLYYQDDVQLLDNLLKRELQIVEAENAHQQDRYAPDQFGYLSMHYVAQLNGTRHVLPEWMAYKEMKAEIQVRTVLQHAWAAVSHALQYKREGDVPVDLRRRLHRLAGLFELADEQFIAIRDDQASLSAQAEEAIQERQPRIAIDAPSVSVFIEESQELSALMEKIESWGYVLSEGRDYVGFVVEECERLGIANLDQLKAVLLKDHDKYLKSMISESKYWRVYRDFLMLLLVVHDNVGKFTEDYLVGKGWSPTIADRVIRHARTS